MVHTPEHPLVGPAEPTDKQRCEQGGGFWDEATQTCETADQNAIRLEKERKASIDTSGQFRVIKSGDTGRLSGFETASGRTLLGLPPSEVRALAEKEAGLQELEIGGQAEQVLSNREEERKGLTAAATVGEAPGGISQIEQIDLDFGQAAISGLRGIASDVLGGATTGALAGAGIGALVGGAAGGPAGAVAGARVGATRGGKVLALIGGIGKGVKGYFDDFISNLEKQREEAVEAPIRTITETKSTLQTIISAQHTNPGDRITHQKDFANQMQAIDDDFDNLKELSDSFITDFLGADTIAQMKEFNTWYLVGGERDQFIGDFQIALANPDPSQIKVGKDEIEAMKKSIEKELRGIL